MNLSSPQTSYMKAILVQRLSRTAKAYATSIIPYYQLILMSTPVYNEIQELRNELQVQTMVTLDLETRSRIAQGAYISHL